MTFTALCQVENAMQRVMIVGAPGSGKSTLAGQLGERTGLPVFYMDHIHWLPDWEERPRAEKRQMALDIIAQDAWIFEGGMSMTYAERLARCDTLIWLDLPVWLRFRRVVWRTIRDHGKRRPDIAEGCYEGFHKETLPFWKWIFATNKKNRERLRQLVEGAVGKNVHHLRSPRDVSAYLAVVDAKARDDSKAQR